LYVCRLSSLPSPEIRWIIKSISSFAIYPWRLFKNINSSTTFSAMFDSMSAVHL
jgi:cytosine/uracil/thiamine/allantoin permease